MGLKTFKPITPGLRTLVRPDFVEITKSKPTRSLLAPLRRRGGRNTQGKMTVRHRGGGHKRRYRMIDFKRRDKAGVPGVVYSIEYDPNRTARIALIHYRDGDKRYIIWPTNIKVGDPVMSGSESEIRSQT